MLIDSSLWIDFTRERSPRAIKQFVSRYIFASDAALAEPVAFEVLRYATDLEAAGLEEQFQHIPLLSTPTDLWSRAAGAGAMDLVISCVAINHGAELVTFDADFQRISQASELRVKLLKRPAP